MAVPAPTAKVAPKPNTAIGCLALVVLVVVAGICVNAMTSGAPAKPGIGHEGRLVSSDNTTIVMGTSAQVLKDAARAAAAKDTVGWRKIMGSGAFVTMASGTRVLVIGADFDLINVRVLDGQQSGRAGWIFDYDLAP